MIKKYIKDTAPQMLGQTQLVTNHLTDRRLQEAIDEPYLYIYTLQ